MAEKNPTKEDSSVKMSSGTIDSGTMVDNRGDMESGAKEVITQKRDSLRRDRGKTE